MTLMTNDLNYFNCPNSPHDQTTSWPFHYLSFTKVAKRFQLCKFSSKKLRIYPSSFLWHKVVCIYCTGCYGLLQRFGKMLFANRVFYGSVRNSGDSLMTVVFMSSAKGVAVCDGVLSSSCKRVRDAAFFLIIMLVTFAATLLKPQKYVSSRTIQKCVEHVSTST